MSTSSVFHHTVSAVAEPLSPSSALSSKSSSLHRHHHHEHQPIPYPRGPSLSLSDDPCNHNTAITTTHSQCEVTKCSPRSTSSNPFINKRARSSLSSESSFNRRYRSSSPIGHEIPQRQDDNGPLQPLVQPITPPAQAKQFDLMLLDHNPPRLDLAIEQSAATTAQCSQPSAVLHHRSPIELDSHQAAIDSHPRQDILSLCSAEDLLAFPASGREKHAVVAFSKSEELSILNSRESEIPTDSSERKRWRQQLKYESTFEDPLPPLSTTTLLQTAPALFDTPTMRPSTFANNHYVCKASSTPESPDSSLALFKIVLPSPHSDTENSPDRHHHHRCNGSVERHQVNLSTGDLHLRGNPLSDCMDHRTPGRTYGVTTPILHHHYHPQQRRGLSGLLQLGSKIHFKRGGRSLTKLRTTKHGNSLGIGLNHTVGHSGGIMHKGCGSPSRRCRGIQKNNERAYNHRSPQSSTFRGSSPEPDQLFRGGADVRDASDRLVLVEAQHCSMNKTTPPPSPPSEEDHSNAGEMEVINQSLIPHAEAIINEHTADSTETTVRGDSPSMEGSPPATTTTPTLLTGMDLIFHKDELHQQRDHSSIARPRTCSDVTDFRSPSHLRRRMELISGTSSIIEGGHAGDGQSSRRGRCQRGGGRYHAKSDSCWEDIINNMSSSVDPHEVSSQSMDGQGGTTTRSSDFRHHHDDSSATPRLQRGFSVRLSSLLHRGFSTSVWLCRSHENQSEHSSHSDCDAGSPLAGRRPTGSRSSRSYENNLPELTNVTPLHHATERDEDDVFRNDSASLSDADGSSIDDMLDVLSGDERTMSCDMKSDVDGDPEDGRYRRRQSSTIPGDTTTSSASRDTSMLVHSRKHDASDVCLVQKSKMEEITQQQRGGTPPRQDVHDTTDSLMTPLGTAEIQISSDPQGTGGTTPLSSPSPLCPPNDSSIVMKVVHKVKCSDEELQRLTREVEFLSQLNHPHILSLLSFVDSATEQWMFFEHAPLGDLYHSTVFKTLNEDDACWLIFQIVLAIHSLHTRHHIIHSDVKPHNILQFNDTDAYSLYTLKTSASVASTRQSTLDQDIGQGNLCTDDSTGQAASLPKGDTDTPASAPPASSGVKHWQHIRLKLCDFGLAQQPIPHNQLIEFDGLRGTHGYFAPELLLRRSYDYKVDLWAIGIIAFTLVGGYEPFFPVSACTKEDVEFDPRYWSEISMECKDFIRGLLQRAPEKRLSSTDALNHDWIRSRFSVPLDLLNPR